MKYQSSRMTLNCIQIIKQGEVNDICVCEDEKSDDRTRYTVLIIKNHTTTRKFLKVLSRAERGTCDTLIDEFSYGGKHFLVFPFVRPRPVYSFYMSGKVALHDAESICSSLILSCIQSNLPYPVLYLILKQAKVNMTGQMEAYLGYDIDLSELDDERREKDCVVECARIIRYILAPFADKKADSYTLIEKRINNRGYSRFAELYKDLVISSAPAKKPGIFERIKLFFLKNKDLFFRILIVLSLIALILALGALVSQLLFGDIPFMRIFINEFKHIGTEYLNR